MSSKLLGGKLFEYNRQLANRYHSPEYLDQKYFAATLAMAFMLHLAGAYIWYLIPNEQVVDIPVRVLNIKLGDEDPMTSEELRAVEPNADNKNDVESAISKLVHDQDPETQARTKSVVSSMEKAMNSVNGDTAAKAFDKAITEPTNAASALMQDSAHKLSAIAKQFVRTNGTQATAKGTGSAAGNSSAKDSEMMSRYEQLISLWIEKFKLYPTEARAEGMQGETVVRIRIDRQGNIRYYILERSTGYPVLDHAAIDMVKRANPVPAVPNEYPQGDLIEFLIPVNFHLQ